MGILKYARIALIFLLFFAALVQSGWADKIYLKNGNVLEGRVAEEKPDSILFEYYLEGGKGHAKIKKTEIKSIEKGTPVFLKKDKIITRSELWAQRENIKYAVLATFFILSLVSLLTVNKILRVEIDRPFGIKISCLFLNALNFAIIFLDFLLVLPAIKGEIFNFKAPALFILTFLGLGIPVSLSLLIFGLFYLRKWARRTWIILLATCLLTATGVFITQKNTVTGFCCNIHQKIIQEVETKKPRLYANIKEIFGDFGVSKTEDYKDARIVFIVCSVILLFFLYFLREKTKAAFTEASQYKIVSFGKKQKSKPDTFSAPTKIQGIIKVEGQLLKGFSEYEALGYHFYLPAGMKKIGAPSTEGATAMFLEKKGDVIFSIAGLKDMEYKTIADSLFTLSSPFFVMLKTLTTPRYSCNTISIKEVKFEEKEGVMQVGSRGNIVLYRFILKIGKDGFLECGFVRRKDDTFFEEKRVLSIIASIK